MSNVELSDQQWGQVMAILADAPWKIANPLLMEMGNQLRAQALAQNPMPSNPPNVANQDIRVDGQQGGQGGLS